MSIVIPALNAAATIGKQLEALLAQADGAPLEIIVVDNGSTDTTLALVRQAESRTSIVVSIDGSSLPRGGAAAKNAGVRAAKYQRVAFCDADDLVLDGWVAHMRTALETNPVVTCDREYRSLNKHLERSPALIERRGSYEVFGVPAVSGGAFGIDRDLYLDLGGFDETMVGAVDSEFAIRLAQAGHRPIHEPRAVVAVRLPRTGRAAFRRARTLSRSSVEISMRHGLPVALSLASLVKPSLMLLKPIRLWRSDRRHAWMTSAGGICGRADALVRTRKGLAQ